MLLKTRPRVITVTQFLIWWGANSLYAVDAQTLLRKFSTSPLLIIDLAFFQILVGMGLSLLINVFRNTPEEKLYKNLMSHKTVRSLSKTSLVIGLLHISATILTNFSYRVIGSTTTLVWKLTEPCAAVVLKRIILEESTDALSLLGVLVIVAGVLTYSVKSLTMFTVSPIILANILFPTRNVVLKLDQKKQKEQVSTEQRYFMLLLSSVPFLLCALAVKLFFEPSLLATFPFLLRNALLFNAYQFASIALLEKLDALTHSLANTMKRFSGILLSALLLRESLTERHFLGLFLTAVGFPLYVRGGKTRSNLTLGKRTIGIVLVMTPLMLFTISSMAGATLGIDFEATTRFKERYDAPSDPQLEIETHKAYMDSLRNVASDLVIMAPKRVSTIQRARYALDKNDIFSYKGDNLGNFVWEHAANDMLPDFSSSTVCQDSHSDCIKKIAAAEIPKRGLYYWPTANIFRESTSQLFQFLFNSMKTGDVPLLIGAGVQAEFGEVDKDIKDPVQQRKIAVENFRYTPAAVNLFAAMENHSYPIMMRGDVTLQTAQRAGYNHGISAGCPSLFLNKDVYLGRTMERKYKQLKNRIGDKKLKIGITLQPTSKDLLQFLLKMHEDYPNSTIFAQGGGDMMAIERAKVDKSRVRMYDDVEEWKAGLREMDAVFGARIHGSMLALGESIPVFVVAPDYRVLELVQRMRVPHMTVHDQRWLDEAFDVAEIMYREGIKGEEFDRNRCELAKNYRNVFGKYGFGVSSFVRQISEIC